VSKVAEVPKNGLATVALDDTFVDPAAYHCTTQQNPEEYIQGRAGSTDFAGDPDQLSLCNNAIERGVVG
jgi:hypothetical protein